MKRFSPALLAALSLLTPLAAAHSGVLDQISPPGLVWLFTVDPLHVWQQQVRVGVEGRLDAFELQVGGVAGAEVHIRLRTGDGWNVGPVVWETKFTKLQDQWEATIFNVHEAALDFAVGDTFVIEVQGDGSETDVRGNFMSPLTGNPPLYGEELFLDGPGCFDDCGRRMMFRTWMDNNIGTNYCLESENSTGFPARIKATGSVSVFANDLVLEVNNAPVGQLGIVYYGPVVSFSPVGNGFMCIGSGSTGLARLPFALVNDVGTLTAQLDNTAPPSLLTQITPASTWYFQAYYRDPLGGGLGVNFSDALQLVFQP